MVFCAACGFDRPLGGYKASLLRDEKNIVVGFKSGWICVDCISGNVPISESAVQRWNRNDAIEREVREVKKELALREREQKIEKLRLILLQADEKERQRKADETHQQFKLFAKKYFNEQKS